MSNNRVASESKGTHTYIKVYCQYWCWVLISSGENIYSALYFLVFQITFRLRLFSMASNFSLVSESEILIQNEASSTARLSIDPLQLLEISFSLSILRDYTLDFLVADLNCFGISFIKNSFGRTSIVKLNHAYSLQFMCLTRFRNDCALVPLR